MLTTAAHNIDQLGTNCTCNTTELDTAEHKVGALTEFFGSDIVAAIVVGLLPTFAMTIGSLVPLVPCYKSNARVQATFQNLSAGIIIAAVSSELFPLLAHEGGGAWSADLALFFGFFIGLMMMFGIKIISEKCTSTSKTPEVAVGISNDLAPPDSMKIPLTNQARQMEADLEQLEHELGSEAPSRYKIDALIHKCQAVIDASRRGVSGESELLNQEELKEAQSATSELRKAVSELKNAITSPEATLDTIASRVDMAEKRADTLHMHIDKNQVAFRRWRAVEPKQEDQVGDSIPIPLTFAVCIDAFVDGFLVGISYIAESQAGFIISGAACIEDGFLGLTFSATLMNSTHKRWKQILVAMSAPLCLLVGAAIGGVVGEAIQDVDWALVGFVSWAMVCLLFLVTQELLFEAIENQDGKQIWWVNVWIFVGIFIVLLAEKLFELVPNA